MAEWRVVHKRGDIPVGEILPEDLEFATYLNRIGYCNYKINLGHYLARKEYVEPYASDYELYRDALLIQGGTHTALDVNLDDRALQISSQDWGHRLERRRFPFNPDPERLQDYQFVRVETDLFTVIEDMLRVVQSLPYSVIYTFNNGTCGYKINYRIDLGDTESIFSKITELSNQEPNGFDFEITPQRELRMYFPKKLYQSVFELEQGKNILRLNYTDKGLDGNSLLGLGAGSSSKVGVLIEDLNSMDKYKRNDFSKDFGNISDRTVLANMSSGELKRGATSVLDLSATVIPQAIDDVWSNLHIGDLVHIHGVTEYDTIDDYFRCVGLKCNVTNQADERLELFFNVDA